MELIYLYNGIYEESKEIEIHYKPKNDNENRVKIFGNHFINKTKYKFRILYNDKEYYFKANFEDIDENYNHEDPITIKLKSINNIIDMRGIFCD